MNWNDIPTIKDFVPLPQAKLTHDQVREIREKLDAGVMNKVICIDYGLSSGTVSDIKHRRIYRRLI